MSSDDRLTPARRQYLDLKRRHPDALLLYRMGDFYELFDEDAVVASRDLHITLTSREFGKGNRVPMAGVPHHALWSYLRRLLACGHRVAIADQLSEPGRGLVERDIVRVLSPGTIVEPGLLAARENNYLVALHPSRDGTGLAYVDVSTGEFAVTEFGPGEDAALQAELTRLAPAECLAPDGHPIAPLADAHLPSPARDMEEDVDTHRDAATAAASLHVPEVEADSGGAVSLEASAGGDEARDATSAGDGDAFDSESPAADGGLDDADIVPPAHFGEAELARSDADSSPEREPPRGQRGSFWQRLGVPPAPPLPRDARGGHHGDALQSSQRRTGSSDHPSTSSIRVGARHGDGQVQHGVPITYCPVRWFQPGLARERLLRHFGVASLEAFGCEGSPLAIGAAAAVLAYVEGTNRDLLRLLRGLQTYSTAAHVALDPSTRRNLELTRAARSGERGGSLLSAIDATRTAMGGRLLRRWLSRPLRDVAAIDARLDVVEALARDHDLRAALIAAVERAGDLERLAGRARQGNATPRDLLNLAAGLRAAAEVQRLVANHAGSIVPLATLVSRISPVSEVAELIERGVSAEEGRMVRDGFDATLDELSGAVRNARRTLLAMEQQERERTGIRSLKIGYNKVFGYYIEVSKANLRHAPDRFVRRQTLANAERFITHELKEWEARILRAEEQIGAHERAVFAGIMESVGAEVDRLHATAAALAELDVFASFAELAVRRRYVRPVVDGSTEIHIEGGRHPVVELALEDGAFVPNDVHVGDRTDDVGASLLLITGPNMAGKSTYLRQTALMVLLAQIGSFVPAERARIGLVDRIFTRVGAQDDLASGASTFMVEMVETAAILRHATARSLLIFDEIGRGTSTYDGLSIAQAVVEDVHDRIGARTLFATHFHELTTLADRLPAVRNYNMAAQEEGGTVVFLRRVVPGGADRSYGIHVARLAGLPEHVTQRAEHLLAELEAGRAATTRLAPDSSTMTSRSPTALVALPALAERAEPPPTARQTDTKHAVAEAARGYVTSSSSEVADSPPEQFSVAEESSGSAVLMPPQAADPPPERAAAAPATRQQDASPARPAVPTQALAPSLAAQAACPVCAPLATEAVVAELRALNLAATTPIQALNLLFSLQQKLPLPGHCTCGGEAQRRASSAPSAEARPPSRGPWRLPITRDAARRERRPETRGLPASRPDPRPRPSGPEP